EPIFNTASDQEGADLVAFLMCLSGSDLPAGSPTSIFEPPGVASKDSPAAGGWQTTVVNGAAVPPSPATLLNNMVTHAQNANPRVGRIVKGVVRGEQRGYVYRSASSQFQPDRSGEPNLTPASLLALAHAGGELTYTVVPKAEDTRLGIDRDENGTLDR